jgi:hypothetical protein
MGPDKCNTQKKDNVMRSVMFVRNKEICLLRGAYKLCKVPKSTLTDRVNAKEQNITKLVNT